MIIASSLYALLAYETLYVWSKGNLYINVHSSIVNTSQNVDTQISNNWGKDKQYLVYPYNQILFGHKKEWSTVTSYDMMNLEHKLSERSQTQKTIHYMIPFTWNVQNRQIYRLKKINSGLCQGEEVWKEMGSGC